MQGPPAARPMCAGLAANLSAGRTTGRKLVDDGLSRIAHPDGEGQRVACWAAKWSVSGGSLAPCLTQHYNAADREVVSTRGVASCACPCKIVSIHLARST